MYYSRRTVLSVQTIAFLMAEIMYYSSLGICVWEGCLSKQFARSKDRWLAGGGSAQARSSTEAQIRYLMHLDLTFGDKLA